MPTAWKDYPQPSPHSTEVEHRLTTIEIKQAERQSANESWQNGVTARITYLERAVQAIIYAIGVLTTTKSGEIAEALATILKVAK